MEIFVGFWSDKFFYDDDDRLNVKDGELFFVVLFKFLNGLVIGLCLGVLVRCWINFLKFIGLIL